VKKRKGHLQVEIDPTLYKKLQKAAKAQGKSVDDLTKEIFLKTMKSQKKNKK
jgi:predicted HicB family RNase H-like nuclease